MAAAVAGAAGGCSAIEMSNMMPRSMQSDDASKGRVRPPPPARQKSRVEKFNKSMQKSFADFFLGENEPDAQQKWRTRCQRLHSNRLVGGRVKDEEMVCARSIDTLDNSVFEASLSHNDEQLRHLAVAASRKTPQPYDPLHVPRRQLSRSSKGSAYGTAFNRQYSHLSTASSSRRSMRAAPSRRARKKSVIGMAYSGITGKGSGRSRKPAPNSRSYAPGSISTYQDDAESLKLSMEWYWKGSNRNFFRFPNVGQHLLARSRGGFDSPAADSIFTPGGEDIDDVFFNSPLPTSPYVQMRQHPLARFAAASVHPPGTPGVEDALPVIQERSRISEIREEHLPLPEKRGMGLDEKGKLMRSEALDEGDGPIPQPPPYSSLPPDDTVQPAGAEMRDAKGRKRGSRPPPLSMELAQGEAAVKVEEPEQDLPEPTETLPEPTHTLLEKPIKGGWQPGRQGPVAAPGTPDFLGGADYVDSALLVDQIDGVGRALKEAMLDWDNSDRREIGKGFVGNLFDREYKEHLPSEVEQQIDEMDEHRPYFTYWATFVQIVIYIVAVAVYGIAPLGFEETEISGEVLKPSLAIERVSYFEQDNLWVGPRQADLIHLGARYSPCMRPDANVIEAIDKDRDTERGSACCIRNDGSGCHQTTYSTCSSTLSYWHNWTEEEPGPDDRTSGSVCGQDPLFCKTPFSGGAYTWPDDITRWPICTEAIEASHKPGNEHMTCQVVGRPCCVGIQGACIITTREYCAFRRGYFHEEATLCSQISCMSEICGMIPFRDPEKPDQFYRLWTSLFLHAGLFQLMVTVLFQFFVMRDVEKLAGWHRTAIIYIGSGIAGSLASATFLPYHVEAGPAGSQFGIIACLFAELFQNWGLLKHPGWALFKQLAFLLLLFITGLLPYVDNYAHLFGFLFGFLLAFALLPFIRLNTCDRRGKLIGVVLCLVAAGGLFTVLVILFYVSPIYSCPNCHYFNCIPFTSKFCQSMEVRIGRHEIY